ncbi:MAG: cytochrome c3 family protein, partial [Planctomycetota bacterium]
SCHGEIDPAGNAHCEMWPGGCTICHDPHGTGQPFLLSEAHVADACTTCHPDVMGHRSVLHTPLAAEPCTVCHDPHEAGGARRTADEPIAPRCFRCHDATRQELADLSQVHDPAKAGNCDACHDPHGSDSVVNLLHEVPELCFGCHEEIRQTVQNAKNKHSVAGEPGGCLVCHTPHGSTASLGLRADPFTLCSECHSSEVTEESGQTIIAVAHDVESAKYLHGPVRQRDCGACHNPHGSDHFRLLVEHYSEDFYAAFDLENYRLCFSCHPQRGVLTEKTSALTGFRNGDVNLHFLHVNKPGQGRTCRACHETHGSNEPKHIRGWVRFGSWRLPIKFTKTETGGSCQTGCHRTRAYDRDNPVPNVDPVLPGAEPAPVEDDSGDGA